MKKSSNGSRRKVVTRFGAGLMALTTALSMSACASTNNGTDCTLGNQIDVPAIVQPQEENFEQEWQEAKEQAKQQVREWYKNNVASSETIRRLLYPKYDMTSGGDLSFCKIENHLPKYNAKRALIDIPDRINCFFEMLDSVNPSEIKSSEDISKIICYIMSECKMNVNGNEMVFEDIPTFEEEDDLEQMYLITNGDVAYIMTSYSKYSEEDRYTYFYYEDGNYIEHSQDTNSIIRQMYDQYDQIPYDMLYTFYYYDQYDIKITKNGQEINLESNRIDTNEVLRRCYSIFEGDSSYIALCQENGITPYEPQVQYVSLENIDFADAKVKKYVKNN